MRRQQKTLVFILYIPFEFKHQMDSALGAEGCCGQTNIIIFYPKDAAMERHQTLNVVFTGV
jgi:hypothetical protein